MMRKTAALFMAAAVLLSGAACTLGEEENTSVPEGTDVVLEISREGNGRKVYGIGTELDPHFFSQNVGLSGTTNGKSWECREEDWALFEQRMREMNLKKIRVMLLPSWFVISESNTEAGIYNYTSPEMESLYRVLDTAKKLAMSVNITMWGVDVGFMKQYPTEWCSVPKEEYEELFVSCFADCIKYLIEEKEYACIKEVTLYNEPNSFIGYKGNRGCETYCELCKKMDEAFREKEIRGKVLFNLSDDAEDYKWLAKTLMNLKGVIDVANSHIYRYGDSYNYETGKTNRDMSNEDICYNLSNYNLNLFKQFFSQYDVPHIWGEFGTRNTSGSHTTFDKYLPERGLDIARILLNFFNMGSVGASYWGLFSQYYSRAEFSSGKIMDMGLWGFADEDYACRPVYYSYSMITRFIEEGDAVYPIQSSDGYIVGAAFGNGEKWSYCVVNNGDEEKTVSFVNYAGSPKALSRYVYDESNVPVDNRLILSDAEIAADGKVISDAVKGRSFVIYTNK